ncbi:MAG: electron transport complex subunit RsxC [Planctomycetota bacterium]|jgi:electron transport complex protein RnfC|nr:electron transport complex subunit RsxC [Planctomycetota bacterium]
MKHLFRGGCHPPEKKEATKDLPLRPAKTPPFVAVSFSQHIGKPSAPMIKIGERVLRGQKIAESQGFVSAPAHASVSGIAKGVVQLRHPLGFLVDALKIENDGKDEWHPDAIAEHDVDKLAVEEIRKLVQNAGIVGMGGATFPTHVKLAPPKEKAVDVLILNGAECEPYLTSDDRLMTEHPEDILRGAVLFARAVGASRVVAGIENNKPRAQGAMRDAAAKLGLAQVEIRALPVMYPQGAEKQLINAILGRSVPSGGLPMDVGVLVHNMASVYAGYDACRFGHPLTERVVTVTGPGIRNPANLWVRIGTMASHLLEECGFDAAATKKLIVGGPMMGMPMRDLEWATSKGGNGILALTDPGAYVHRPCIRCARCVDACPMGLIPCALSNYGESGLLAESLEVNALDCIECGCCSYVCPSKRPIVQWVRMEKAEINRKRQLAAAAKK